MYTQQGFRVLSVKEKPLLLW